MKHQKTGLFIGICLAFGTGASNAAVNDDLKYIQLMIRKPVGVVGVPSPCLSYQINSLAEELEQMQKSEVLKLVAEIRETLGRLEFRTYAAQGFSGEMHYVKMHAHNHPQSPVIYGPIKDGGQIVRTGERPARNLLRFVGEARPERVASVQTGELSFGPVRVTQYFWDPANDYFEETRRTFYGGVRDRLEDVKAYTNKTRGQEEVSVVPALDSLRPEAGYYPQLLEWYLGVSVADLQTCSGSLSWTDIVKEAAGRLN